MKKRITVIFALCLATVIWMCGSLNVAAASYVLSEDFNRGSDCAFLAPGDMDADGKVDADDLMALRRLLLKNVKASDYAAVYQVNSQTAKYSDINGDGFVNIKDFIRQKKNSVQNSGFVSNGVMTLNGNSALKGAFTSALVKNAAYTVSITYQSASPIKIKMADLGKEIVFDAASKFTTVTKTFQTPATVTDSEWIDFQIIGEASVEKISVIRVNMDNDLADNW